MERFLRHIDLMTRQRNRSELAVCLAAALRDVAEARQVSLYKVFSPPGDLLVGLIADADATGARSYDDGISWPEGTGSVDRFPYLRERLGREATWIKVVPGGSTHHIFEARRADGGLFGFADILTEAPLDGARRQMVDGLLTVMRNCLDLLDYSETDTLTGLLNRKTFDRYLLDILARIGTNDDIDRPGPHRLPKRRHPLTEACHWLGVVDVDHFKSINDRFGHLIGDEVLILVAQRMQASFRSQDKLFRFGGEEFVVLLKPTEFDHARATFDRFRQSIEDHDFPQVGHVTLSIGFTRIRLSDTPSEVLGNADEALYWAKEHGRNRTCAYEELLADGRLRAHSTLHTDAVLFEDFTTPASE